MSFSSWFFPPRINQTIRNEFYTEPRNPTIEDPQINMAALILSAVYNTSTYERSETTDFLPFGLDAFPVYFKDVMWLRWQNDSSTNPRESKDSVVRLDCVLCEEGVQNGDIYDACRNYTQEDHVAVLTTNVSFAGYSIGNEIPLTMPSANVPTDSCGICTFTLCEGETDTCAQDHTMPFPVIIGSRPPGPGSPHPIYEFRSDAPMGQEIPYEDGAPEPSSSPAVRFGSTATATPTPTETPKHVFPNHEKEVILGCSIPLGILATAAVVWVVMRRRNKHKAAQARAFENTELQEQEQGGAAVREHQEFEVPPPSYNDAMNEGKRNLAS